MFVTGLPAFALLQATIHPPFNRQRPGQENGTANGTRITSIVMTAIPFPVTHSVPSPQALVNHVLSGYAIAPVVDCRFYLQGINDTYLVTTTEAQYVLRVYCMGWRTTGNIQYELDVLNHLTKKRIPVADPVAKPDGSFVHFIDALEGRRAAVLFRFAPGRELIYDDTEARTSYEYGKAVAQIHLASSDFQAMHDRFALDSRHLITDPLSRVAPLLKHRPDDLTYIQELATFLQEWLRKHSEDLERGFCHGDFHGGNAHMGNDGITFFDFDCCGVGLRAYDIAVFRWCARLNMKESTRWPEFLRGYQSIRCLNDSEIRATDMFVAIRHIWLLGLHAGLSHSKGSGWLNDQYFNRHMKFLKEWDAEYRDQSPVASSNVGS